MMCVPEQLDGGSRPTLHLTCAADRSDLPRNRRESLSRVEMRTISIRSNRVPSGLSGLRIVHLSDLHIRCWTGVLADARRQLLHITPELVVITGDFGDAHSTPELTADLVGRLLEGVRPVLGCYGVLGNHDDARLAELLGDRVRILANEHATLEFNGGRLVLAGVDGSSMTSGDVPSALYGSDLEHFAILLTHFPSTIYQLPPRRVDLMLAGHAHAGQIRVPRLGPLWPVFDGIPRRYCWGFHHFRGTPFYVSAGLGCSWAAPIRLCCPPEITVITLECAP